ncbi:60Kd inner membrane protein-domain-containing protein [Lineolata rhizophorae]|uniref:60Kd inner membrane protein-domain-containing protein n=1 Tax=Lineolata rhizophorae TaxID=578093 RepID=A0A6A6NWE2_9PEZI|nr:60Kd inner membrane protein-domain-containing protein [Lineolata rhizophorae]
MLPSRGLRPALYASRRAFLAPTPSSIVALPDADSHTQNTRQLSSLSSSASQLLARAKPLECSGPVIPRSSIWRRGARATALPAAALSSARFASTATAPTSSTTSTSSSTDQAASAVPAPAPTDASSTAADFSSHASLTDLAATEHIAAAEPHIGWLHSLGFDYGWGPTSTIQWLLEHVHVWSGMPWWGSVVVTTLAVRAIMWPLLVKQSDNSARSMAMAPVLRPLQKDMWAAQASGDSMRQQRLRDEISRVWMSAGIQWKWMVVPPVVTAMMAFGSLKLMRAMAALPVPGLEIGGFLWLTDLTVSDPFYIVPLANGSLMYIMARYLTPRAESTAITPSIRSAMTYVLPALFAGITAFQPGILQLSWFAALFLQIFQVAFINNATVRRKLGMAPLIQNVGGGGGPLDAMGMGAAMPNPQSQGDGVNKGPVRKVVVKNAPPRSGIAKAMEEAAEQGEKGGKGFLGSLTGGFDRGRDAARKWSEQFQKELQERRGKEKTDPRKAAFLRDAERYEKRRQEEIEAEKLGRR